MNKEDKNNGEEKMENGERRQRDFFKKQVDGEY